MRMKSKLVFTVTLLLLLAMFLGACSKAAESGEYGSPPAQDAENPLDSVSVQTENKIVYYISFSLTTGDLSASEKTIQAAVKSNLNEFIAHQSNIESRISFVLRIKSDRIDEFLSQIESIGEKSNYHSTAEDVSNRYYSLVNDIDMYQQEFDWLTALAADPGKNHTTADMIAINTRKSEVLAKLKQLTQDRSNLDSQVEFSTITIDLQYRAAASAKTGFGKRLSNVFKGACNAFVDFLQGIVIVFVAIVPFLPIPAVIAGVIVFAVYRNKRKNNKPPKN